MIGDIDPAWLWMIGGIVLLIAELIAPGFFLMFIGAAAIGTGLLALFLPIGLALQFATFAVLGSDLSYFVFSRVFCASFMTASCAEVSKPRTPRIDP